MRRRSSRPPASAARSQRDHQQRRAGARLLPVQGRANGTNADGQTVAHIQPITFTVATSASGGSYVDVIGFAVFQITDVAANSICGQAVTGAYADQNDMGSAVHGARLGPW